MLIFDYCILIFLVDPWAKSWGYVNQLFWRLIDSTSFK